MNFEAVRAFYQKLATDEAFRTQIQGVKSKEECSQIVKATGFNFTQQEFEEYTAQMLEAEPSETELKDLDEKELEAVVGGFTNLKIIQNYQCYGSPRPYLEQILLPHPEQILLPYPEQELF